jgi:hypothetical protein
MPDEHTHPLRAAQRGEDYRVLAKAIRAVAVRTRLPAARPAAGPARREIRAPGGTPRPGLPGPKLY